MVENNPLRQFATINFRTAKGSLDHVGGGHKHGWRLGVAQRESPAHLSGEA